MFTLPSDVIACSQFWINFWQLIFFNFRAKLTAKDRRQFYIQKFQFLPSESPNLIEYTRYNGESDHNKMGKKNTKNQSYNILKFDYFF